MNLKKTFLASAVAVSVAGMAGCGTSSQDTGTSQRVSLSGLVVDGYLANARVYLDVNANGRRDSFEPFAYTDNDGYFTSNPDPDGDPLTDDAIDYCRDGAPAAEQKYCLRSSVGSPDAMLRVEGGYDVFTGEPFDGSLAIRKAVSMDEAIEDTTMTPLSTLAAKVGEENIATIMGALGLDESHAEKDFLNDNGNIDQAAFKAALKVHKAVTVIADALNRVYEDELEDNDDLPRDAADLVYGALAEQLEAGSTLATNGLWQTVADNAETSIMDVTGGTSQLSSNAKNRLRNTADKIVTLVDSAVTTGGAGDASTEDQARAIARVTEVAVKKAVKNNKDNMDSTDTSDIDALTTAATTDSNFMGELEKKYVDISGAVDDDSPDSSSVHAFDEGVDGHFAGTAEKMIELNDEDDGYAEADDADDSVEKAAVKIVFVGDTGDTQGTLKACVRYGNKAFLTGNDLEADEEAYTKGALFDGTWRTFKADNQNSLLLTLNFAQVEYSATMKYAGDDDLGNPKYRFDYGGELEEWTNDSGNGLEENTTNFNPTSNEECANELSDV